MLIPILTSAPTADTHNNIKIKANNVFVSLLIMIVIPPSFRIRAIKLVWENKTMKQH
jgi:hypothetical protein